MTRMLRIPDALKLKQYEDGTWGATIKVDNQFLTALILDLTLLHESLADCVLCVGERDQRISLKVTRTGELSVGRYASTSSDITLSLRDFDFLNSFLLKYYRDGLADVDHIDIDIHGADSRVEEGVLTVKVAAARPPMSGEEARRILGIA